MPSNRNSGWAGPILALFALIAIVSVPILAYLGGRAANTTVEPAPPGAQVSATGSTGGQLSKPVSATVAAGAHDFVRFGCDQCHGFDGSGGVSPDVPSLTTLAPSLTEAELTNIINTGRGISTNPTKPFMPVWHGIISKAQIADLVAYLHAGLPPVADAAPLPVPKGQGSPVAGSIDYINFSCINCHGPNGLGGVPNPQSPDRTIPPLGTPEILPAVQHAPEDRRGDQVRQRHREAPDRQHATLGRDPHPRRDQRPDRLHPHPRAANHGLVPPAAGRVVCPPPHYGAGRTRRPPRFGPPYRCCG